MFLSARPHGTRHRNLICGFQASLVSIRAPAWDATACFESLLYSKHVSIRAPAWDATQPKSLARYNCYVSIRAPAWDATYINVCPLAGGLFLSARPHGTRLDGEYAEERSLSVSIRAPAWDATRYPAGSVFVLDVSIRAPAWDATWCSRCSRRRTVFLSARPHGTRQDVYKYYESYTQFLSARPHGTRP